VRWEEMQEEEKEKTRKLMREKKEKKKEKKEHKIKAQDAARKKRLEERGPRVELEGEWTRKKEKKRRWRMRRAELRIHDKARNLVNELHCQTANWLTNSFEVSFVCFLFVCFFFPTSLISFFFPHFILDRSS
jgi:hypothetical protein